MGRASRKGGGGSELRGHWTDTHPDRSLWSPGRLAQARTQTLEEYEALYGRGVPVEPENRFRAVVSPLFPDMPIELSRRLDDTAPLTRLEIIKVLSYLDSKTETGRMKDEALEGKIAKELVGDPVMEALWENIWQREVGSGDFDHLWERARLDTNSLRNLWEEKVLPRVAISSSEDALAATTTTLVQVAFREGYISADDLADWVHNHPRSEEVMRQEILAATPVFLADYPDTPADSRLHDLAYRSLRSVIHETAPEYDQDCALLTHHSNLVSYLEQGGFTAIENFKNAPVHNSDLYASSEDPSLLTREFWREFIERTGSLETAYISDSSTDPDTHKAIAGESSEAARTLLARQVLRLLGPVEESFYAPDDLVRDEQQEYAAWDRYIETGRNCPLENLRPLFKGMQSEERLEALLEFVEAARVQGKLTDDAGEMIRYEIYNTLPHPQNSVKGWAESLASIIRNAL